jgi:hypothetical protein
VYLSINEFSDLIHTNGRDKKSLYFMCVCKFWADFHNSRPLYQENNCFIVLIFFTRPAWFYGEKAVNFIYIYIYAETIHILQCVE